MTSTLFSKQSFKGGSLSGAVTGLGTLTFDEPLTSFTFQISGTLLAETIAVTLSLDGTNFTAAIKPWDLSTSAAAAAATLGVGVYSVTGGVKAIQFTKSAGVQTATINWFAKF